MVAVGSRGDVEPFCALIQELLLSLYRSAKNDNDKTRSYQQSDNDDHRRRRHHEIHFFLQPNWEKLAEPLLRLQQKLQSSIPSTESTSSSSSQDAVKLFIHRLKFTNQDFYGVQEYFANKKRQQQKHRQHHSDPKMSSVQLVANIIGELILPCWEQIWDVMLDDRYNGNIVNNITKPNSNSDDDDDTSSVVDCDWILCTALARPLCFMLTQKAHSIMMTTSMMQQQHRQQEQELDTNYNVVKMGLIHLQPLYPNNLFPNYRVSPTNFVQAILDLDLPKEREKEKNQQQQPGTSTTTTTIAQKRTEPAFPLKLSNNQPRRHIGIHETVKNKEVLQQDDDHNHHDMQEQQQEHAAANETDYEETYWRLEHALEQVFLKQYKTKWYRRAKIHQAPYPWKTLRRILKGNHHHYYIFNSFSNDLVPSIHSIMKTNTTLYIDNPNQDTEEKIQSSSHTERNDSTTYKTCNGIAQSSMHQRHKYNNVYEVGPLADTYIPHGFDPLSNCPSAIKFLSSSSTISCEQNDDSSENENNTGRKRNAYNPTTTTTSVNSTKERNMTPICIGFGSMPCPPSHLSKIRQVINYFSLPSSLTSSSLSSPSTQQPTQKFILIGHPFKDFASNIQKEKEMTKLQKEESDTSSTDQKSNDCHGEDESDHKNDQKGNEEIDENKDKEKKLPCDETIPSRIASAPVTMTEDNILHLSSIPYPYLLPHCSMMICHGGAGVIQACLSAGIPCIVIPVMGDQFAWARLLHAKGLGLYLSSSSSFGTTRTVSRNNNNKSSNNENDRNNEMERNPNQQNTQRSTDNWTSQDLIVAIHYVWNHCRIKCQNVRRQRQTKTEPSSSPSSHLVEPLEQEKKIHGAEKLAHLLMVL